MLIYADNCNRLGTCRAAVDDDQTKVREALHSYGLDTHDVIESSGIVESLGVRVDGLGGKVHAAPHRDWHLDRALLTCLPGRASFVMARVGSDHRTHDSKGFAS